MAQKAYNWLTVVYPESVFDGWQDLLCEYGFPWLESPLHSADTGIKSENDINEKHLKSHIHLLFSFESQKTYDQVKVICDKINAIRPQQCYSIYGSYHYFTHDFNLKKEQFKEKSIPHCGFNTELIINRDKGGKYITIKEMIKYCKENYILFFDDLVDYAIQYHYSDWFPLLCSDTLIIREYLYSRREKAKPRF